MNSLSSHSNQLTEHKTENQTGMRFGDRYVNQWVVYLFLVVLTASLFVPMGYLALSYQAPEQLPLIVEHDLQDQVLISDESGQTAFLISQLKNYGLWEVDGPHKIPRFFIKSYPADLKDVSDITLRKKVFINSLLPHALYVRQETLYKRNKLKAILNKIGCAERNLDFNPGRKYGNQCSWEDFLAEDEVSFIRNLSRDYRTTSAEVLLERVDAIPTSIILAQGALESSWGSSRFTREGNSIFGMWTWKTAGIVPAQREEGKTHKVKSYDSILESVRAYHLTLNRLDSYEELRQLRLYSDNPLILAEGLRLYSERGQDYVEDIKRVILTNNLQRFDSYSLTDLDLPVSGDSVTGVITLVKPDKVSL